MGSKSRDRELGARVVGAELPSPAGEAPMAGNGDRSAPATYGDVWGPWREPLKILSMTESVTPGMVEGRLTKSEATERWPATVRTSSRRKGESAPQAPRLLLGADPWMIEIAVILSGVLRHWRTSSSILVLLLANATSGSPRTLGGKPSTHSRPSCTNPGSSGTASGVAAARNWCRRRHPLAW